MECSVEKTKNANEVKLTIKIEAEKFTEAIQGVYSKSKQYFNIPGFRKGRAPQQRVEMYYGKEIFYEDAFNDLVPGEYDKALKENNIEAVSRPQIDVIKMEKGQDLEFTAIVQTKPVVKVEKYKGIEIPKIEYNVEEKDIEDQIKQMQEKNARLISVETPAEKGNTVVMDFEGFVDGVAFEGGKAENHELEIGSGKFIPGFEDQLIGMKVEEEKDIEVKFPEDYYAEELAGKDATFKVKVHEIKKKEVPEIDDEFAKDVSEFDTVKELKDSIKEKLEKQNSDKEKYEKEEAVLKVICDNLDVDIPSGMIEIELDNMIKDMEQRISYQGIKFEQYLQMMGKTESEFRKEYEPQAIESIKTKLALEEIIKQEKIEASEEDIKSKIEEMAKNYGRKPEEMLENESIKDYIKQSIENEKAIDLIVENAKVKKEDTKKETAKKSEEKATTKKKAEKESKTKK